MNGLSGRLESLSPYLLSILRIVAGLLFLEHGTQKVLGVPGGERAFVDFFSLSWGAGVIELVTGALLVAGFWTRLAAFFASGEMAVAYWMAHAPQSFFPANNGGDAAILYCFVFLFIVFAGPGPLSVVAAQRRERGASADRRGGARS